MTERTVVKLFSIELWTGGTIEGDYYFLRHKPTSLLYHKKSRDRQGLIHVASRLATQWSIYPDREHEDLGTNFVKDTRYVTRM
jgi:pyruvate carboxylase